MKKQTHSAAQKREELSFVFLVASGILFLLLLWSLTHFELRFVLYPLLVIFLLAFGNRLLWMVACLPVRIFSILLKGLNYFFRKAESLFFKTSLFR